MKQQKIIKSIKNLKYINQDTNEEVFTKEQIAKMLSLSLVTICTTLHKFHDFDGFICYKYKKSYYYPKSSIEIFNKIRRNDSQISQDSIIHNDKQLFSKRFIAKLLAKGLSSTYNILKELQKNDGFICYKYKKTFYYPQSVIDMCKTKIAK